MAAIWVVFGHSAVKLNNEKWPADFRGLHPGPSVVMPER